MNLAFFKIIRSKTKFWQMIGRRTRLCPNLFGVGQHKEYFCVFDFCQNFEFFNQNPDLSEGATGASLSERLFVARVGLIGELDRQSHDRDDGPLAGLRRDVVAHLREEVDGVNVENFVIRSKRRLVEKYKAE